MNPNESITAEDRESLARALDSFRSYLLFVAWRLNGEQLAWREGPSELVLRTIDAAMENIREGNIPGPTDKHRKAWLWKILFNISTGSSATRTPRFAAVAGLVDPGPDRATSPSGGAFKE